MTRHLIPHIAFGRWGGAALTHDGSSQGDDVAGWSLTIQWLGLLIDLGVGAIRPARRP